MKSFIIKELPKSIDLETPIILKDGFKYKIKADSLKVKEIIILEPFIIDSLILSNFNKRYKKILEYYFAILQNEDESSDGNFIIALNEIARLRSILIRKYNQIVSKKIEKKMLDKLKILENEIRIKITQFNLIKEQEYVNTINEEATVGKSR